MGIGPIGYWKDDGNESSKNSKSMLDESDLIVFLEVLGYQLKAEYLISEGSMGLYKTMEGETDPQSVY